MELLLNVNKAPCIRDRSQRKQQSERKTPHPPEVSEALLSNKVQQLLSRLVRVRVNGTGQVDEGLSGVGICRNGNLLVTWALLVLGVELNGNLTVFTGSDGSGWLGRYGTTAGTFGIGDDQWFGTCIREAKGVGYNLPFGYGTEVFRAVIGKSQGSNGAGRYGYAGLVRRGSGSGGLDGVTRSVGNFVVTGLTARNGDSKNGYQKEGEEMLEHRGDISPLENFTSRTDINILACLAKMSLSTGRPV